MLLGSYLKQKGQPLNSTLMPDVLEMNIVGGRVWGKGPLDFDIYNNFGGEL